MRRTSISRCHQKRERSFWKARERTRGVFQTLFCFLPRLSQNHIDNVGDPRGTKGVRGRSDRWKLYQGDQYSTSWWKKGSKQRTVKGIVMVYKLVIRIVQELKVGRVDCCWHARIPINTTFSTTCRKCICNSSHIDCRRLRAHPRYLCWKKKFAWFSSEFQ